MSVKNEKGQFTRKPKPKTEVEKDSLTSLSSPVKRRKKLTRKKTDIMTLTNSRAGTGILHVRPMWTTMKDENELSKTFGHTKSDRKGKWEKGGLPRISFKGRSQEAFAAVDRREEEEIKRSRIPDPDDDTKLIPDKRVTKKEPGNEKIQLVKQGDKIPDEPKDLEALRTKAIQDVETFTQQIEKDKAVQTMRTKA